MSSRLLPVILATTALAVAATVPTTSRAEGISRGQPSGAERWRLRPADVTTTGSTVTVVKDRPAVEIPAERRAVRVVYPGLLPAP